MSDQDEEWPEEGEIVMCTVQKVERFGAFVSLDEYGGREGFIHISEVSTNWVKNIRDFFREGRKVVVKVVRIDRSRGQIDLSLKRVTEQQKKYKIQEWKQRQKAEKLLEMAAKKVGKSPEEARTEVVEKLLKDYPDPYSAFEDVVVHGREVLDGHKISKRWADVLYDLIISNIEIPTVKIHGIITLQCFEPNGVEVIRNALSQVTSSGEDDGKIAVQVIGPPKYRVTVEAEDYKSAESILEARINSVHKYLKGFEHTFDFSRTK